MTRPPGSQTGSRRPQKAEEWLIWMQDNDLKPNEVDRKRADGELVMFWSFGVCPKKRGKNLENPVYILSFVANKVVDHHFTTGILSGIPPIFVRKRM